MTTKNCVAYMRCSTDSQTENSIEYQRAAIAMYCCQNGLTVQEEFVDEAFSASNDRRPGFQRMIEASKNKPDWNTILVYDFSRIFRNPIDAPKYKEELRDRGIKVISIKEKFPDSAVGRFMEAFIDVINAFFVHQTREKTHAGMSTKASKAEHCGGVPPLGYDVGANGKLTVNEADTVREIFRLYNLGYSYNKMVTILNNEGLRTKAGKPFTKNSFSNILTQEKYIGVYRWNKRKAKNSKGQHNNHAYKPVEEQTVIPGGCPAIIPLEQFQATQKRLSQRKQGRADTKSRKHHYMLGGMKRLKCAECGAYMVGKVTTSHGKKYTTYACPHHKGGGCPTKDIQAKQLEWYISNIVERELLRKACLPQLNQCLESGGNNAKAEQLRNRLTSIEKKIDNIVRNLENGYSKTLTDRLHLLEEEKVSLTNQIQTTSQEAPTITPKNLKKTRRRLVKHLCTSDDPDVKELLRAYITEITVSNEGVTVDLHI